MACATQTHIIFGQVADRADQPRTPWLSALAQTCIEVWQWRRGCHDLLELDDRQLADVGVTREDAERQAREWFERWLWRYRDGA